MKALLFLLATGTAAFAQTPLVLRQPAPQVAVVSPLTSPTAQSNQQLLNQINSTISQRTFQHQVLTLQQPAQPVVITASPGPIRVGK